MARNAPTPQETGMLVRFLIGYAVGAVFFAAMMAVSAGIVWLGYQFGPWGPPAIMGVLTSVFAGLAAAFRK
jgi:hypothetical protein